MSKEIRRIWRWKKNFFLRNLKFIHFSKYFFAILRIFRKTRRPGNVGRAKVCVCVSVRVCAYRKGRGSGDGGGGGTPALPRFWTRPPLSHSGSRRTRTRNSRDGDHPNRNAPRRGRDTHLFRRRRRRPVTRSLLRRVSIPVRQR